MKYYVNSIKNYDDLMKEMEAEGFRWINGDNPKSEISEIMKSDLESGGIVICYDGMTEGTLTWRGEIENKYRGMLFDYSVIIKRKEDVLETLKKLETDNQDCIWSSGEKPTEFIPLCDFDIEDIEIFISKKIGLSFRVVKKNAANVQVVENDHIPVVYVVQRLLGDRITTDSVFRTFQAAEKFVLEQGAKPAGYYRYDGGLFEYEIEQMEVRE